MSRRRRIAWDLLDKGGPDRPATQTGEFISLGAARPVLDAMTASLPPELGDARSLTDAVWDEWVRSKDDEIRGRVEQGEILTLSNLLRLGITYTREPRLTYDVLSRFGHDRVVDAAADRRASDLLRALVARDPGEGMVEMRTLLGERGVRLDTPEERGPAKAFLLDILARQRDEAAQSREEARIEDSRSELFRSRGLSTDSDLYAGYTLDEHLRNMHAHRLLASEGVRRVAVIGAGLDYVNKKSGFDFHPPQALQPFSVIDSLFRLGLADRDLVEVCTFDVSPRVNRHIERARARAVAGIPRTVQLLRPTFANPAFNAAFTSYWQKSLDQIGKPVPPIPVPSSAKHEVASRAVSIRPGVVAGVKPADLNIVLQTPADRPFDLVIGTNVFIYYNAFEQGLVRVNLSAMIKPGGFLVSNTPLSSAAPGALTDSLRTDIVIRSGLTDYVYSYLRQG